MGEMDSEASLEQALAEQLAVAETQHELAEDQLEHARLRRGVLGWFSVHRATARFTEAEQHLRLISNLIVEEADQALSIDRSDTVLDDEGFRVMKDMLDQTT